MVKTPKTRHSRTRREPVTIDLKSSEVTRTTSGPEAKTDIFDLQPSPDSPRGESVARETAVAGTDDSGAGTAAGGASPAARTDDAMAEESRSAASGLPGDTPAGNAPEASQAEPAAPGEYQWRQPPREPDLGPEPQPAAERHAPPPPPVRRPAGRMAVLAAGLIGGVVALAGGGLLQYAGLLGVPGHGPVAGLDAGLGGVETRIGAIETEIAELKQQTGEAGATAEISGRVDGLAAAVDQMKRDMASLQDSVRAAGDGGNADLSGLDKRISGLEAAVAALGPAAGSPSQEVASLNERIAALDGLVKAAGEAGAALGGRLGALEESVSSLGAKVEAQAAQPEVARAIAASALQSAIERGAPFQAEIETFAAVAPDAPAIDALRAHAETGVATRAEIAAEAEAVADEMMAAASPPPEDAGVFERLLSSARSLVTVRPTGAVKGAGVPETVARMEVAVKAGDLEKALAEFDALPDAVKAAGADFAGRIRARVEVEKLADQAIASAMKA